MAALSRHPSSHPQSQSRACCHQHLHHPHTPSPPLARLLCARLHLCHGLLPCHHHGRRPSLLRCRICLRLRSGTSCSWALLTVVSYSWSRWHSSLCAASSFASVPTSALGSPTPLPPLRKTETMTETRRAMQELRAASEVLQRRSRRSRRLPSRRGRRARQMDSASWRSRRLRTIPMTYSHYSVPVGAAGGSSEQYTDYCSDDVFVVDRIQGIGHLFECRLCVVACWPVVVHIHVQTTGTAVR